MLILLRPAADRVQGPAVPVSHRRHTKPLSNPGERKGRSLQQILAGLELGRGMDPRGHLAPVPAKSPELRERRPRPWRHARSVNELSYPP